MFCMENETVGLQITTKGEVFGMESLLPLYMMITSFASEDPKPTLRRLASFIERTFERGHRRALANEDGMMDAADAAKLGEIYPIFLHHKQRLESVNLE